MRNWLIVTTRKYIHVHTYAWYNIPIASSLLQIKCIVWSTKKKNIFYLPIDFIFNSNENYTVDYRYFKQCYLWHIIYPSSITRVNLFIGFSYFHPTGNDTVNTGKSALALRAQCIYMYVLHKPWVNVFFFPSKCQNILIAVSYCSSTWFQVGKIVSYIEIIHTCIYLKFLFIHILSIVANENEHLCSVWLKSEYINPHRSGTMIIYM